tara:strand:- start:2303 stop:2590 length:288 start_codon:yes stop_codon:yes gene_type:complete
VLVELIQIKEDAKGDYFLNSVFVNTQQIVYLSENRSLKQKLQEGKLKLGLNQNFTNFTDIRLNHNSYASHITVVGDPGLIELKIFNKTQKQLLKG